MKSKSEIITQKKSEIESIINLSKGYSLDKLNFVNEEIAKIAVIGWEHNMDFIDKSYLTNDFLKEVISCNGMILTYVENPSEELKMIAIKQNGIIIEYLENITKEMELETVKSNPFSILFIDNPSYELQLEAVSRNGFAIECIDKPSIKIKEIALNQNIESYSVFSSDYISDKLKVLALKVKDIDCSNILARKINGEWQITIGHNKNLYQLDTINQMSTIGELSESLHAIEYLTVLKSFS